MQRQALVVDDSRVARLTLSKLLAPYDLDIIEIASGEEALSYLQANNDYPDIIFMDVTMKGLDGLETTKRIKENEVLSDIPVVMCTGHDTQSDQNHALDVGAVAALTKPPKEDTLAKIMAQLTAQAETEPEIDEPEPELEREPEPVQVQTPMQVEPIVASPTITPEMDVDLLAPNDDLIMQLEQQWLPKIQQAMDEKVGDITRRIAAETVKGIMANQVQVEPQKADDNSELESNITANIERDFLPKIQQTTRDTVEDVSRQIVSESVEAAVSSHVASLLPALKKQFKEDIKHSTVEIAQQAAQQMIDQSAETAVQFAIEDSNLLDKTNMVLDQQGTKWLAKQEQPMSLIVAQQAEQHVSPLITQYLDVNLKSKIDAHLAEIKAKEAEQASQAEEDEGVTLNEEVNELTILVEQLSGKVSLLNSVIIGLWIVLLALVAVTFL